MSHDNHSNNRSSSLTPTKDNTLLNMNSVFVAYVSAGELEELRRNTEVKEKHSKNQVEPVVCR